MNRKQFSILLVLVVLLGAIGVRLHHRDAGSWQSGTPSLGRKLLGDLPVNDVATIAIRSETNGVTLAKKDALWRVKERGDYPADYAKVRGFLLKAMDLKAAQTEEVGPSQLGRYGLLPPGTATNAGTLVEFRDATGTIVNSFLVGKPHLRKANRSTPGGEGGEAGWPDGRYVMTGAGSRTVALISDPLDDANANPAEWLNKDFFKVERIRSIAVTFPAATNSWRISRETESGDWKLADAQPDEQLDASKTSSLSYALSSPAFVDVLPAGARESTGLEKPTAVTLETFDNFNYRLSVGQRTNDNYYLTVTVAADLPTERPPGKDEKPEDKARLDQEFKDRQAKLEEKLQMERGFDKWIYLVSGWTVDSLLKERSQWLVEKKSESKPDESAAQPKAGASTAP